MFERYRGDREGLRFLDEAFHAHVRKRVCEREPEGGPLLKTPRDARKVSPSSSPPDPAAVGRMVACIGVGSVPVSHRTLAERDSRSELPDISLHRLAMSHPQILAGS